MGRVHRYAVLAAAGLAVAGCGGDAPAEAVLEARLFALGGRDLSIAAPPGAALTIRGLTARLELRPGARVPQRIDIALAADDADAPQPPPSLSAYTDYSYRTWTTPGGSGGQEARLEGVWAFGGRRYYVSCVTQREGAAPEDATWCLPLLRRFGEAAEPPEPPEP